MKITRDKGEPDNAVREFIHKARTKSFIKSWSYALTILEHPYFKARIIKIRKKFSIPENGFKLSDKKIDSLPFLPKKWLEEGKSKKIEFFNNCIDSICREYSFDNKGWFIFFGTFILYNVVLLTEHTDDTLIITRSNKNNLPTIDNKLFPILMYISPYANERDLLDYVRKCYKNIIEPLQIPHRRQKVKINRIRKKKDGVKERDDLIYENRHLSRKAILRLLYEKYGRKLNIDYGYIGKIISNENKKRKEM